MAKPLQFMRSSHLATMVEKGLGGRHSNPGITVAVFGGTGLIGRNLITRMGREGVQTIIPHRLLDKAIIHYKPMADLGQFNFIEFYDIRNDAATEAIVQNADVVVNCVGRTHATSNYALDEIHVQWPDKLAKMCKKFKKDRLVHMSAYGADIKSPNDFLRTKAAGEKRIRESFPEAVIIRPALVFGKGDFYLRMFRFLPHLWGNYLIGRKWGGEPIIKVPLYVGDAGQAVLNACKIPKIDGETFELFGPDAYHLKDLYLFVMTALHNWGPNVEYQVREVPVGLLKAYSALIEGFYIKGRPPINRAQVDLYHRSELPRGLPGIEDLNVKKLNVIEENLIDIIRIYRTYKTYYGTMEELTVPEKVDLKQYLHPPGSRNLIVNAGENLY